MPGEGVGDDGQKKQHAEPVYEITTYIACFDCGTVVGQRTFGPADAGDAQKPVHYTTPCPQCGCEDFGMGHLHRIVNIEDFDEGEIAGTTLVVKGPEKKRPIFETKWKQEIYRDTGEPYLYERVYNRSRDLYFKRYTNLRTGEVTIESLERLSDHQGRGSARSSQTFTYTESQPLDSTDGESH